MKKILCYPILLITGLAFSQLYLPLLISPNKLLNDLSLTLIHMGLGHLMLSGGLKFSLNKYKLNSYKTDILFALAAASTPWVIPALYFIFDQYPFLPGNLGKALTMGAVSFALNTISTGLFILLIKKYSLPFAKSQYKNSNKRISNLSYS